LSLRRRLFLTLCIVVLFGFLGIARWIRGELRNSYSQVVEEILVDYAHFIAAHVETHQLSQDGFNALNEVFNQYKTHKINAKIFNFVKQNPSLELYVTDVNGTVIYSTRPEEIGQNFSQWNDVYKTLRGDYGARSTRLDLNDSRSSVYFVAAPIVLNSKIVGVATVYKTESSILVFLDQALNRMFLGGLFSVVALGFFGGLIMIWITLPLERLRMYALNVSEGRRGVIPESKIKEVKHLSEAFEKMRISLEGKKTIEKYTQTLTHELKSPLTAIKGAAELCLEEIDREQQKRFLKNIIEESNRSHNLLEQLLKIAALESKQQLDQKNLLDPIEILNEVKEATMGLWRPKNITIQVDNKEGIFIEGDRLLLFQAFRNIIQNAIEFSKPNENIDIQANINDTMLTIKFCDQGTGIPEFAKERVFEKFYSLERPDTKKKSSGLGLSFVKEVIELHNGKIWIESPISKGVGTCVQIQIPAFKNTN
jgi:two-component system, OmpR family, sensor histidine kinase CreC